MKSPLARIIVGALAACPLVVSAAAPSPARRAAVSSVSSHAQQLIGMSDQIWAYAETALRERQSSKLLAEYAEAHGFTVTRGVSGMPTAFIARFGTGRPREGWQAQHR